MKLDGLSFQKFDQWHHIKPWNFNWSAVLSLPIRCVVGQLLFLGHATVRRNNGMKVDDLGFIQIFLKLRRMNNMSHHSKDLQETRAWFEVGRITTNLRIWLVILYSLKRVIRMVSRVSVSKHLLAKFWVFLSLFFWEWIYECVIRHFWLRVPFSRSWK